MPVGIKVDWDGAVIEVFFLLELVSLPFCESSMFYEKGT